jgi:hypothetical protein
MTTLLEVLQKADARKIAVGHFNVSDLVTLYGIVEAARQRGLPVVVGASEDERRFIGVRQLVAIVKSFRDEGNPAIFLNADHTHSLHASDVLPKDREEALRLGAAEVISIPSEEAQSLRRTLDIAIDTVGGKAQTDLFALVRKGGTLISSVSVPDAQQRVVRIGQVLPPGAARQAHEMLERLRPLPAGKIALDALGGS